MGIFTRQLLENVVKAFIGGVLSSQGFSYLLAKLAGGQINMTMLRAVALGGTVAVLRLILDLLTKQIGDPNTPSMLVRVLSPAVGETVPGSET